MTDQPVLVPVLDAHRFDEASLSRYLAKHLPGFHGDLRVQQYHGGASNPTFLLQSREDVWVMRKRPPGDLLPSAHQVDREYRVMAALQDTDVPVPEMHLYCDDVSVVGREFYIMEMVEGRLTTSDMPSLTPADRSALYEDFIRVLAALHTVDHEAVGLARHGRPGNYFARQIDRWSKQYIASATETIPEMDNLIEWMPRNIPPPGEQGEEVGIIHGDYRIGNVLSHPTEPKIAAVLDWELSTLGHPMGDAAYNPAYTYYQEFTDYIDELPARGIPTEEEWLRLYCQYSGRDKIEHWPFYVAYNIFRLAAIVQGVYKRGLDGNAGSDQPLEERRANVIARAQRAWAEVEKMG